MSKKRKILRGIAVGVLCLCTAYLVYSTISDPFRFKGQNIMLGLAVVAGFIGLASNKK